MRLHHWWCSRLPGPASPGMHTWPQPPLQLSPMATPGSPTSLHTIEIRQVLITTSTYDDCLWWVEHKPTSLSTALKRPLLVFVVRLGAAGFLEPPNLFFVLLLIVSAFSLGASPSMTKTSFTPISVRDDTLKNKFLHTNQHCSVVVCDRGWRCTIGRH